ncbi:MAG TPA: ABC transporter permease, partial [Parasegetibacter sp.]
MLKLLNVLWSSFKMALQELRVNKLRTFLSLFGITIGIFCIIGILSTINSLKFNIQSTVSSLGANTIYIQKEPWSGANASESWRYASRPNPRIEDLQMIKDRAPGAEYVAFLTFGGSEMEYLNARLDQVTWYAITEDYHEIQPIDVAYGRYFSPSDFQSGSNKIVMGYANAEKLFGLPELAVGKSVTIKGRKATVAGVMKKYGQSNLGGWDFDNICLLPYHFAKNITNNRLAAGMIMVKGREGLSVGALKEELTGAMRSIRKLSPLEEDNFSLNEISAANELLDTIFDSINAGGWAIA